ncbi:hypothetical protein GHV40_02165 [Devosia sp. D6-9]|nr:hypothetical protein GHV40_02165 [Devosia sp. D6-9]
MFTRRHFLISALASSALLPSLAAAEQTLTMKSLYKSKDQPDLSDAAQAFSGTEVTINGFMAPPLKPDAKFFVLATEPMAICPFCDAASQWPQNIVLVYTRDAMRLYNYDVGIAVTGKLDIGVETDADTGFVSVVRLVDATYRGRPTVSIGF